MVYNQFLYNSALYNAGREEVGAVARSIIQAHTGPHIQAVVGSTGGVSFISDFVIEEGAVTKPPSRFYFPDLKAWLRARQRGTDNISVYIRGWAYKDLPAAVYTVDKIPDLPASIFGLFEANLIASITGMLGQHDLAAIIDVAVANLPAVITGAVAPDLPAVINELLQPGQKLEPKLYARIHAPLDLSAIVNPVKKSDLPGTIQAFQFAILSGQVLSIPAPSIIGFIRGVSSGTKDLPSTVRSSPVGAGIIPATITPVFTGDTGYGVGLLAQIQPSGGFDNITSTIRGLYPDQQNLGAFIKTAGDLDLPAVIYLYGADNISASIGAIPLGAKDRFLPGFLQVVIPRNLSAYINADTNVAFLGATIEALRNTADMNAYIRVAETFVTTILTVSTLAGRDLRATIGNPGCLGGSGNKNLGAYALTQHARDLGATITSFVQRSLGASINTSYTFHAIDTIEVSFDPTKVRTNTQFLACDGILISFSPFRGKNLGATITPVLRNADLAAIISATFPLPRVVPAVNSILSVDLRSGKPLNPQEIQLRLEGEILEFFYVNGADEVFTQDANEDWKINVSSFKPVADNLFGEYASARIRRLGSLVSFANIDEAIRFCIQAVIGYSEESNLTASITACGGVSSLAASIGIINKYRDISGKILPGLNTPVLSASIEGTKAGLLYARIRAVDSSTASNLSASISQMDNLNLSASINYPAGAQPPFAYPVNINAQIYPLVASSINSYIQAAYSTSSLVFGGTEDEYVLGPTLTSLGSFDEKLTVAFWLHELSTPTAGEGIIGSYSDYTDRNDGFGFRWVDSNTLEFSVNGTDNYARADIVDDAQWYFVVGVYDATLGSSNIKLYLNASAGATVGNYQQPVLGTTNQLVLGRTSNFSSAAGGSITETHLNAHVDSVGIWEEALSPTEISSLYNGQGREWYPYYANRSGYDSASNLVLSWTFEGVAETLPLIESSSFTTAASGIGVNLSGANVSTIVPSSNVASMYSAGLRYWTSPDSSSQPLPNGYQGSFSILWVGTFETSQEATVVGMWKSGDVSGSPSLRITRRADAAANGKKIEVQTQDENGVEQSVIGTTAIEQSSTVWHSLIYCYNASTLTWYLYIDGSLDSTGTLAASREAPTEFTIAASRTAGSIGDYFIGKIDTVSVWDKVLSAEEISWLSNLSEELWLATHPILSLNLKTWYRLGEVGDTYARIYDWSGNGGAYLNLTGSNPDILRQTPN